MMGREYEDFLRFFPSPSERKDELSESFHLSTILASIIGVSCLAYVVLMCVCRHGGQNKTKDEQVSQLPHKTDKKTSVVAQNGTESGAAVIRDKILSGPDAKSRDHTSHVPANIRASARLLPAPPVSTHQNHAMQSSAPELSSSGMKHGGHISDMAAHNNQHLRGKNVVPSGAGKSEMSNSDYEHLGQKSTVIPSDYDSLNELKSPGRKVVPLESSGSSDNDYSELDDKPYPEVIEVSSKRKELSDPYCKVKDNVELKDEDPYNHIGESDGTVSAQVIQQLKQSSGSHAGDSDGSISAAFMGKLKQLQEQDDPYATVQDGSDGMIRTVIKTGTVTKDINSNGATGTTDHFDQSLSKDTVDVVEEYAVVHKTKGVDKHPTGDQEHGSEVTEFSPYGVSPPEPPRLYTVLDMEEHANNIPKHKTKYKYSQITARESLASISARTSENPYESMPDTSENAYTLVESSPVEEIETVHRAGGFGANRISQISDTYAEIGISGGSVNYDNISTHLENNENIASSTTITSRPANRASRQHIYSNSNQSSQNCVTSAGVAGNSSNLHGDIQEYEKLSDTYLRLNEESSTLSLPATKSQELAHLSNRLTVQGHSSESRTQREVKGYADYEDVDETRAYAARNKLGLQDNKTDAGVENKKVGQRRKMLDNKQGI